MGGLLDIIAKGYQGPSVLDSQQQAATIAQQHAQTAKTGQDLEIANIQKQAMQRQLRDTQVLTDALKNTDRSLPAMRDYAIRNGISAPALLDWQAGMVKHQQAVEALTKEQRENLQGVHSEVGDILGAVKANPDSYPEARKRLEALEPGVFPAELPADPGERGKLLDFQIGAHGAMGKMLSQAKTNQETQESAATTGLKVAQIPKEQALSVIEQTKAAALKHFMDNPTSYDSLIDTILPPANNAQMNAAYKADIKSAMATGDMQRAQAAVSDAAAHAGRMDMATNPQIRQGKVADAVATETALSPLKVQQAVATERATGPIKAAQAVATEQALAPIKLQQEVAKQVELAKQSPDAFGSILSPQVRMKAQDTYEKDSKAFADKLAQSQQLQDYVAAAQSGNKAAPALIPIEELRGLVNRVNRSELQSVSGGGSVLDRVQGWVNKATTGQNIPPAVLKDINALANVTAQAAERGYKYNVDILNKTYGAKAEPIQLSKPSATSAPTEAPKFKAGDSVMYQGKPHKVISVDPATGKVTLEP